MFLCTDLSISTWRRMASRHRDPMPYTCEGKHCLAWFIRAGGHSFKREVLYEHMPDTRFANVAPSMGAVMFLVEHPPMFYKRACLT